MENGGYSQALVYTANRAACDGALIAIAAVMHAPVAYAHGAGSAVAIIIVGATLPLALFLAFVTKKLKDALMPRWRWSTRTWKQVFFFYVLGILAAMARCGAFN